MGTWLVTVGSRAVHCCQNVYQCLFQVVLEVQKGSTGRQEDRCCSDWGRTKVDIVMIEFHFSVVQWHSHTEIIVQ